MIRVLPPVVVNQIAAGEVIERPASVVKELVENSLDAGARTLRVEITDGGRELIRISDDGAGFSEADLPLAFVSHATSKLSELGDLDHIASLGFRGEALASIGSVARCSIRSRIAGEDSGHEIHCGGGEVSDVKPCGCPAGTQIEVRELFFNTPARRRFLKRAAAERARIQDLLMRMSLMDLELDLSLHVDGREVLRLPRAESLEERIARCFGVELRGGLIPVQRGREDYRLTGFVADPDLARRDGTRELLYINGRLARDRTAQQAIRQAYRPYLIHGRFAQYFLMLDLPPDQVDVNVHPSKAEIRFLQGRLVCGMLHTAVAESLAGRGRVQTESSGSLSVAEGKPRAHSGFPDLPKDLFARAAPVTDPGLSAKSQATRVDSAAGKETEEASDSTFRELAERQFLQIMDLYLVFEGVDEMVVVDQHALHERVLYERFKRQHAGKAVQVQRLLVPELLSLSASDKEYLLNAREALAEEGFLIEDFSGEDLAIQGIPALLRNARPAALLESFLHGGAEGDARPKAKEAIIERFHSMACRSAIMAGDALEEEEIRSLLEEARDLEHPHHCPHGRPTVLRFGRSELERFFRRRV
ncbi:MAG: DNA mismatch repair endonuclease MutL [Planctomycetota bacterium]|jgi:DNA mismatch repair protein MutL